MTSVTPNNPIICGDKGDMFDIVLPITEQLKAMALAAMEL